MFARLLLFTLCLSLPAFAAYQHFEARQVHPLAMSPDGTRLVAVDSANARVTVFDLSSGTPVRQMQIAVGLEPASVQARTNDEFWVVNEVGDSISIISLAARNVVATLRVGDEPTDVIFAAGKAYVACARAQQIRMFNAETREWLGTLSVNGIYPHALAANDDGSRLYAAFLLSGNRTTVLKRQIAPDQPAPTNPALPAPPDTALIVPANDPRVTQTILDHDVVEIDTSTFTVTRYISDVGTNLFDLDVRPGSQEVWVTNTEALNQIRFEPELRGHFAENRVSIIRGDQQSVVDLNPGLDYSLLPNPTALDTALAQPGSLLFTASGDSVWVAAFASDRIAKLNALTGVVEARVDVRIGGDTTSASMRGPRGLVLDEPRGRLYVLNKLSSTLSEIDTTTLQVTSEVALSAYDPMPASIRAGRGYLFDARLSGNGTVSCGTCHMDADRDGLAWDLGDPGGQTVTVLGAALSVHDTTPRPNVLHPMKGPMVTQTLRGMQNGDPFHWRGDKPTLQSFNSTFDHLMGGSEIDDEDMDDLAEYLTSLVHAANPNRNLDRSLPTSFRSANPVNGRTLFNNHTKSHCAVCHLLPEGSDHNIDLPQETGLSQPVKTPPLRTTYQRVFFDGRAGTSSLSGFGLLHDGTGGSISLPTVHPYVLDLLSTPQEFADVTAFIHCFDTGTAPTVGYSRTVTAQNRTEAAVVADLALLEARAATAVGDCDLVVHGVLGGVTRKLRWTGTAYQTESAASGTMSRAVLLAALNGQDALTFSGVLPGAGARMSVDEDEDSVLNLDDPDPGIVNGPPKISEDPQSLAVVPNDPATLRVMAEGIGLSFQWKRGTVNVGSNSPVFSLSAATVSDSGSYTVVVSNSYGSRTSKPAVLSVVPPPVITRQPLSRSANEGTNASFSVTATGSNLSYRWMKGGVEIGGATKSTLLLGGVGAQDAGSYSVLVTNGATSVTSQTVHLAVVLKPVMNDLNLPDTIIGQSFSHPLSALNLPTRFSISGLPPGLTYSTNTGLITGKPTLAKTYLVKASGSNIAGTSPIKEDSMIVEPFPVSVLGTFQGIVPRHSEVTLTNQLGGRMTLTTTNLGAYSGTLVLGTVTHSFRGSLIVAPGADPTGSTTILRSKLSSLTLSFTLLRASRSLEATVSDGTRTLTFSAALPTQTPALYGGNYTLAMKLRPEDVGHPLLPQGHSVAAFRVATTGAASGVIRLADASAALTFSGPVTQGGRIPCFVLLYGSTGSLLGSVHIHESTGSLADSSLSWFKHAPKTFTRSYQHSFGPLALETVGRRYIIPPLHGIALGLSGGVGNAKLLFRQGGAPSPETRLDWNAFEIQKGSPAKILPPTANPGTVRLTVTPGSGTAFTAGSTGSFSGTFVLNDSDTSVTPNRPLARTASFFGMIVDDGSGQKGYGFFNLAEMPAVGPPKTTSTTTKMLSGSVELLRTAP